jgi:hypothetical protein
MNVKVIVLFFSIDATNSEGFGKYVNHSKKNANTIMKVTEMPGTERPLDRKSVV